MTRKNPMVAALTLATLASFVTAGQARPILSDRALPYSLSVFPDRADRLIFLPENCFANALYAHCDKAE